MTVAALPPSIDYLENGVTLAFAAPFRFAAGSLAATRVLASGVAVELASGVDFSTTGGETDAGGTLTLVASIAGSTLRIRRVTARAQSMDYTAGDRFPAESHEAALDRAMLVDQEQDVAIDDVTTRALMVPVGETAALLGTVSQRALTFATFDALGNINHDISVADVQLAIANATAALANQSLAASVLFQQAGAGTVLRTLEAKVRETKSLLDFFLVPDANYTNAFDRGIVALNAAGGGRLIVPPIATYYAISDEVTVRSNVEICGEGMPEIRQTIAGKRAFVGSNIVNFVLSGVYVKGVGASTLFDTGQRLTTELPVARTVTDDGLIHINGTVFGLCANVRIERVRIAHGYNGLVVTGIVGLLVEHSEIHDFTLYGLLASRSSRSLIFDNRIHDCVQAGRYVSYGIQQTGGSAAGFPLTAAAIVGNRIWNIISWDGIMCHECDDLLLDGNEIWNVRNGIDLSTAATAVKNVRMIANRVKHTTTDAWTGYGALHGSYIVNGETATARITGLVMIGNISEDANKMAGALHGSATHAAFAFEYIGDAVIHGNIARAIGSSTASFNGIHVYRPGDGISIEGNPISGAIDSTGYAIRIEQAAGGDACENLSIRNNSFKTSSTATHHTALLTGAYNRLAYVGNSTNTANSIYLLGGTTPSVTMAEGPARFTPSLKFGGASVGMTYGEQYGSYYRSGNKIDYEVSIQLSAKGSSSGAATITGLPLAAASVPGYSPPASYTEVLSGITAPIQGKIVAAATAIQLGQGFGAFAALDETNFANTSIVNVAGSYTVS